MSLFAGRLLGTVPGSGKVSGGNFALALFGGKLLDFLSTEPLGLHF